MEPLLFMTEHLTKITKSPLLEQHCVAGGRGNTSTHENHVNWLFHDEKLVSASVAHHSNAYYIFNLHLGCWIGKSFTPFWILSYHFFFFLFHISINH